MKIITAIRRLLQQKGTIKQTKVSVQSLPGDEIQVTITYSYQVRPLRGKTDDFQAYYKVFDRLRTMVRDWEDK